MNKDNECERGRCFEITISEVLNKESDFPPSKYIAGQVEISPDGDAYTKLAVAYNSPRQTSVICREWNVAFPGKITHMVKATDARVSVKSCTLTENRHPVFSEEILIGETPRIKKSESGIAKGDDFEALIDLCEQGDSKAALEYCKTKLTSTYVLRNKAIKNFIRTETKGKFKHQFTIEDFVVEKLKFPFGEKKDKWSAVLFGSPDLCKTKFALANFNHPAHIKSKSGWSEVNELETDGIVIDDFDYRSMKSSTLVCLLDGQDNYHQDIKYGHVKINAGTPRILCCNDLTFFWPRGIPMIHVEATIKRCVFFHVLKPLSKEGSEGEPTDQVMRRLDKDEVMHFFAKNKRDEAKD